MNVNILLKVCAMSGIENFYKFALLNRDTYEAFNTNIPVYLKYLSQYEKKMFFINSVKHNLINYVKAIIDDKTVDLKIGMYFALKHGHKELGLMLIEYIDENGKFFTPAVQYNNFKVFKIVMSNPKVNPNMWSDYAFRKICQNGNLKMMKFLFEDERFSINKYHIYHGSKIALTYKHILLAKYLEESYLRRQKESLILQA
jgi:hypothetical protein